MSTVFGKLVVFAGLLLLCGCDSKKVNSDQQPTLSKLRREDFHLFAKGLPLLEAEKVLGGPGNHQFSVRLEGQEFCCYSYAFENRHTYLYFIFRTNCLEKIVFPPPANVKLVPYRNVQREIRMPLDAEARVAAVMRADGLSSEQFGAWLDESVGSQLESFTVLPAFVAASPEFMRARKDIQVDHERNAMLAEKYDPAKIKLGNSEEVLHREYGPPISVSADEDGTRLYLFGSNEPLRVNPALRFSNVAVVVAGGTIERIFSHDFFDAQGNYSFQ
jgi:hypothetical protein